jgi:DNA-directed RNA polymerase specialized sigma subunit
MKVRAMNAKRRAKEKYAAAIPHSDSANGADEALLEQLDHELNRLPEKYRVPVVLCELEGRSRKEVARLLGVPEGTLSWRLAHAKKLLAKRLTRHGATLSLVALASAMTSGLSPALRASTVKAVLSVGSVPANVLALTEGVMKAMFLTKLKITFCFAALALMTGVGATGLTYRATADEPLEVAQRAGRPQADDLESLRLEIEALRKELRSTRERLKTLEEEVRGQKGRNAAEPRQELRSRTKEGVKSELSKELESARREIEKEMQSARREIEKEMKSIGGAEQINEILSTVEEELKKALEQIDDKQVTETLQKALKNLKTQKKTKKPAEPKQR